MKSSRVGLFFAAIVAITASAPLAVADPNYQACVDVAAKALPYCDVHLSHDERVKDLLSHLTLDEKIGLISPDPSLNTCNMMTKAIDRIGLPQYMWLVETNTGVASNCLNSKQCATTFAGPEGLAASFNRTVWRSKGDVISTELRAMSNANWHRGQGPIYLIGFDGFGPNMNIARDPRFGRNSELPGEDPLLTGAYASEYVQGMQQVDDAGFVKMIAYVKHFDAYSVELNRGHDNHNISAYDFSDTYLPAFERVFVEGKASGAMCSYNAENGRPSCANGWLLNDVMRGEWGAEDAVVMSDCGAISNLLGAPANAPSEAVAAAWAINNGTDIEAGSTVWTEHLRDAVDAGLTTEAAVDASARRAMLQLMRAGRFDAPESVSWTKIGPDVIDSDHHKAVNYEAALQSFVLLKNEGGVLPLREGSVVAVVGPQGVSTYGLLEDYYGDDVCFDGGFDCFPSIAAAVTSLNGAEYTLSTKGVDINSNDTSGIEVAVEFANKAEVVILVLGIDKTVEYEGADRTSIALPGEQEALARAVLSTGKPTILVLVNGGALAIDSLIDGPRAIVEAFNPGKEGARALADTLFGRRNRWGKLPITVYPAAYVTQVDLNDFSMTKAPGRTYRYYTGTPLFEFGHGLSLTTFVVNCTDDATNVPVAHARNSVVRVSCAVHNGGAIAGDEVVLVFHRPSLALRNAVGDKHPVPLKRLVAFERVSVEPNKTERLTFEIVVADALSLTDATGAKVVYEGAHELVVSHGVPGDELTFPVNVV